MTCLWISPNWLLLLFKLQWILSVMDHIARNPLQKENIENCLICVSWWSAWYRLLSWSPKWPTSVILVSSTHWSQAAVNCMSWALWSRIRYQQSSSLRILLSTSATLASSGSSSDWSASSTTILSMMMTWLQCQHRLSGFPTRPSWWATWRLISTFWLLKKDIY